VGGEAVISERLKKVILSQLGLDDWDLQDSTVATEVPGWDSLSHALVIAAVEGEFGLRFSTREILQLASVGQLQALVDSKQA
jgi:acyl carrier protein